MVSPSEKELFSTKFCQECHRCCDDSSEGSVLVFPEDLERIAKFFEISRDLAMERYCEKVFYDYFFDETHPKAFEEIPILRLLNPNGSCIFYENKTHLCEIYDFRPQQCRDYPFLSSIIANPIEFKHTQQFCPAFNQWIADTRENANIKQERMDSDTFGNDLFHEIGEQEALREAEYFQDLQHTSFDELYSLEEVG